MDSYQRERILRGKANFELNLPNGVLTRDFSRRYAEVLEFKNDLKFYQSHNMDEGKPLIIRLIDDNDLPNTQRYVQMGLPFHENDLRYKYRPLDYAGKNGRREIFAYLLSVTDWSKHEYEQDTPFRYVYHDEYMYNLLLPHLKRFMYVLNEQEQGPFTFPFIFGDISRIRSILREIPIINILDRSAWTDEESIGDYTMKQCIKYGRLDSIQILYSSGVPLPIIDNPFVRLLRKYNCKYVPEMFSYLSSDLQYQIKCDHNILNSIPKELIAEVSANLFNY